MRLNFLKGLTKFHLLMLRDKKPRDSGDVEYRFKSTKDGTNQLSNVAFHWNFSNLKSKMGKKFHRIKDTNLANWLHSPVRGALLRGFESPFKELNELNRTYLMKHLDAQNGHF